MKSQFDARVLEQGQLKLKEFGLDPEALKDKFVLDVACGNGEMAIALRAAGIEAFGVDQKVPGPNAYYAFAYEHEKRREHDPLKKVPFRFPADGVTESLDLKDVPEIEKVALPDWFVEADLAKHLPFPDHSVDLVVTNGLPAIFQSRPFMMREILRVLKTDGEFRSNAAFSTDSLAFKRLPGEEIEFRGEWKMPSRRKPTDEELAAYRRDLIGSAEQLVGPNWHVSLVPHPGDQDVLVIKGIVEKGA